MLLMYIVFCSFARGPNGLMVNVSDWHSEGVGFKSHLDPEFFLWIYFSLAQQHINFLLV